LHDIRAKIFPFKRKKIKAQEVLSSISLPAKRKERSLSSLVVSAPKVSMQPGFTGKRTKNSTRKAAALRGCSFLLDESIKKEQANGDDNMVCSILPDSSNMTSENESQVWAMGTTGLGVTFLFVF